MKTFSFLGSDKNAGKTTVLNFVYNFLIRNNNRICVTSIGINGERLDNYESICKPSITIHENQYFLTSVNRIKDYAGGYSTIHYFGRPHFKKDYILGLAHYRKELILEGPNEKSEIIKIKSFLSKDFSIDYLLIDGSIDRQFLGHPKVSDAFYFAVLISKRKQQLEKTKQILFPLNFSSCESNISSFISEIEENKSKSILFNENFKLVYHGKEISFLDKKLKSKCLSHSHEKNYLYLKSSLSKSLYKFLAPFRNLIIILNNFTLYQNISICKQERKFNPEIVLLYPVKVHQIFVKQEDNNQILKIPKNISVHNLFRENPNEIRVRT